MADENKILPGSRYEDYMDMERYQRQLPAIHSQYYHTNLLSIIDHLPKQNARNLPQTVRSNVSENREQDKGGLKPITFTGVTLVQRHEFDGLGNDTYVNQFQIVKSLLGKGSHSFVKLGKADGNSYAIKTISLDRIKKKYYIKEQQIVQMINSEIQILRSLKSPFIIGFHEAIYAPDKERIFIVLEYCSKGSLLKTINKCTLPFQEWQPIAGKYFVQMVRGIKEMHDKNIIHRDIKSENVLINEENQIKIIDFNVSLQITGSGEVTITDKFVGTKTYAPPELLLPSPEPRVVDGRLIDIWALGVTFLELLQRRHPFSCSSLDQLLKMVQQPIQLSPSLDSDLQGLIKSMLNKENRNRPSADKILQNPWVQKMESLLT